MNHRNFPRKSRVKNRGKKNEKEKTHNFEKAKSKNEFCQLKQNNWSGSSANDGCRAKSRYPKSDGREQGGHHGLPEIPE